MLRFASVGLISLHGGIAYAQVLGIGWPSMLFFGMLNVLSPVTGRPDRGCGRRQWEEDVPPLTYNSRTPPMPDFWSLQVTGTCNVMYCNFEQCCVQV